MTFEPFDPLAEGIQREKVLLAAGRASQQLEAMGIDPVKAFEGLTWLVEEFDRGDAYDHSAAAVRYLQYIQRGSDV